MECTVLPAMPLLIHRFLLAKLQLEEILLNSPSDMGAALKDLPRSPSDAYRKVLARIEKKGKVTRTRAYHALSWVFHAIRPLERGELLAILNVERDGKDSINSVTEIGHIIEACEGLIVCEWKNLPDQSPLRFAHSTVRVFLQDLHFGTEQVLGSSFLRQSDIALSCIRYIASQRCDDECRWQIAVKHKFANYAATFWAVHAKGEAETVEKFQKEVFIWISDERIGIGKAEGKRCLSSTCPNCIVAPDTILHFLAANGLAIMCGLALDGQLLISSDR